MNEGKSNEPTAPGRHSLVVFLLDGQRYALPLYAVERILRAVEVQPLPKVPEIVLGAINVQGRILPVVNLRRRFALPEREIQLGDQLIITRTAKRDVALVVDAVGGVAELCGQDVIAGETVVPGLEYREGTGELEDGIVLIHDMDQFLSPKEERELAAALERTPPQVAPKQAPARQKAILVAEESIPAGTLLKTILESAGYKVKTAVDGVEALSALQAEDFDLLVSDVDMPRMSGFELIAKVRADKKLSELPVVLVTALEAKEDRELGIDAGANAYIAKSSFDQSNLLEIVRRLI
jgi:two-component system chemotaxis sensor kinase CheA